MSKAQSQGRGIAERIERLSEALVFAEPSDVPALGALCVQLEEVCKWAAEAAQPTAAAAAERALRLVEEVILEETADGKATLEIVGRTVSALRALWCNGLSPERVDFPEELGLEKSEAKPVAVKEDGEGQPEAPSGFSLPSHVDESIFSDFLARQGSALEEMEEKILALERGGDEEALGALRRLLHTMKGEAALLGLADVERLCHTAEDALNENGFDSVADRLLEMKDWLGRTFDFHAGKAAAPGPVDPLLARLKAPPLSPETEKEAADETPEPSAPQEPAAADLPERDAALLEEFVAEAREHLETADVHLLTLETEPENDEALNAAFRAFHTIKGVAGFLGLDAVRTLAHEAENLLDRARRKELALAGGVIDLTFDTVDALKRLVEHACDRQSEDWAAQEALVPPLLGRIKAVSSGPCDADALTEAGPPAPPGKRLGEILVESGATTEESVEAALREQQRPVERPRLGELLVRSGDTAAKEVAHALRSQKQTGAPTLLQVKETVKVDADRFDRLVEMIGELVIAESMVFQSAELRRSASAPLARHLEQLNKITRELQQMGASLRMAPVRSTFQKMTRLARDLAKKSGKRLEFVTAGEDTELDKSVVDRVGDPLVHLVRNAVDHGLEASPEERRNCGKPEAGRVELRAFNKGGNIYIEVEDDGRGLDHEAILAKAREKGLVRNGEALTDREVLSLIFQPGFSTAKTVTEVSGRGVGLDVVKRNVETLRGQIDVQSQPGRGSVFSMRLPLTLAVIDGMGLRVGEERYILPTLSIVTSIRPQRSDLSTALQRGEMLLAQGKIIPLFRLDALLGIPGAVQDPTQGIVVVVEDDGRQAGLLVDQLLGQQQIVIKSLGDFLQGSPGLSGGAIMPDGTVGLILDVGGLVRLAHADGQDHGAGHTRESERIPGFHKETASEATQVNTKGGGKPCQANAPT